MGEVERHHARDQNGGRARETMTRREGREEQRHGHERLHRAEAKEEREVVGDARREGREREERRREDERTGKVPLGAEPVESHRSEERHRGDDHAEQLLGRAHVAQRRNDPSGDGVDRGVRAEGQRETARGDERDAE